ncbi:hypothetical protein V8F06_009816 [Rhypophila decipiens]
MKSSQLLAGAFLLAQGAWSQFTSDPDTTADPNTVKTCTWWHVAASDDTCASIATAYGLTAFAFTTWNPSLAKTCTLVSPLPEPTGGITTTTASPTPTGNGIATPTPIQTGMVGNCNKFHLVKEGEGCASIQGTYGVSLAQLASWNPAIGSQCTGMWLNTHLCVGVVGSTTTAKPTTTSTKAGNGIATPTPTEANMVGNCDRFHKVFAGDQCGNIATKYGIPIASFYSWNPAVGNTCASLWADTYVCVRTIGFVAPKTTTTTTTTTARTTTTVAGGVATPTPTQTGMVSGCKKFHKVVAGDQCGNLATRYSITLANFYSWNPAVGNNCQSLWAAYCVCVGR